MEKEEGARARKASTANDREETIKELSSAEELRARVAGAGFDVESICPLGRVRSSDHADRLRPMPKRITLNRNTDCTAKPETSLFVQCYLFIFYPLNIVLECFFFLWYLYSEATLLYVFLLHLCEKQYIDREGGVSPRRGTSRRLSGIGVLNFRDFPPWGVTCIRQFEIMIHVWLVPTVLENFTSRSTNGGGDDANFTPFLEGTA